MQPKSPRTLVLCKIHVDVEQDKPSDDVCQNVISFFSFHEVHFCVYSTGELFHYINGVIPGV